jgi:cytochrome c oxidase subunit 3
MAVLSPTGSIHGGGAIPPLETGFGGGGSGGEDQPQRFRPHLFHVGIALGIVSIASFFGALAIVYAIILGQNPSPHAVRTPALLWVSTALILLSSFALERSRYALRRGLLERAAARLRTTLVLGNVFLASQLLSWWDLARQGVYLERNPQGSMFYLFTGLHGLHLAGGILWLAWLVRRSGVLDGGEAALRRFRLAAGAAAIYWHFLGALWLFLFVLLLLWS